MATWEKPRIGGNGRWNKYQRRENMTREIWDQEMKANTSPHGQARMARKEGKDYSAINAKYRNEAKAAHGNTHCRANMGQNQHRRYLATQLY